MKDKSLIILIGGTSGVGKTTLADKLSIELTIDQRIGTEFLRAALQAYVSEESLPFLFHYTFRGKQHMADFEQQAAYLKPAILSCIACAKKEGTSLVIEGNHILPELYKDIPVDIFLILDPPTGENEHLHRVLGSTHSKRTLEENDFENIKNIGGFIERQATQLGIRHLIYSNNFDEIVSFVRPTNLEGKKEFNP